MATEVPEPTIDGVKLVPGDKLMLIGQKPPWWQWRQRKRWTNKNGVYEVTRIQTSEHAIDEPLRDVQAIHIDWATHMVHATLIALAEAEDALTEAEARAATDAQMIHALNNDANTHFEKRREAELALADRDAKIAAAVHLCNAAHAVGIFWDLNPRKVRAALSLSVPTEDEADQ